MANALLGGFLSELICKTVENLPQAAPGLANRKQVLMLHWSPWSFSLWGEDPRDSSREARAAFLFSCERHVRTLYLSWQAVKAESSKHQTTRPHQPQSCQVAREARNTWLLAVTASSHQPQREGKFRHMIRYLGLGTKLKCCEWFPHPSKINWTATHLSLNTEFFVSIPVYAKLCRLLEIFSRKIN